MNFLLCGIFCNTVGPKIKHADFFKHAVSDYLGAAVNTTLIHFHLMSNTKLCFVHLMNASPTINLNLALSLVSNSNSKRKYLGV